MAKFALPKTRQAELRQPKGITGAGNDANFGRDLEGQYQTMPSKSGHDHQCGQKLYRTTSAYEGRTPLIMKILPYTRRGRITSLRVPVCPKVLETEPGDTFIDHHVPKQFKFSYTLSKALECAWERLRGGPRAPLSRVFPDLTRHALATPRTQASPMRNCVSGVLERAYSQG